MKRLLTTFLLLTNFIYTLYSSDGRESDSTIDTTYTHQEEEIFTGEQHANLIDNPGFENRTSRWTLGKFNGGAGLFTIDTCNAISGSASALVITENADQDYSDVQLFAFFSLSEQTQYSISFNGDVASACLISLSVSNGIETFFEEKLLLRPGQLHYGPFNFKSDINDPFSYIAFNLGRTNSALRFDDVVVKPDSTDKKLDEILANSGINLLPTTEKREFFLQLPTQVTETYSVVFLNERGITIKADKINRGFQEKQFSLKPDFENGKYKQKAFTPTKTLANNYNIE